MDKRPQARRGGSKRRWILQNGPAIREFRELTRWSGTALAAEIGVDQSTLSNYEREHRSAPEDTLERIAEALGIEVEAIRREKTVIRADRAATATEAVA